MEDIWLRHAKRIHALATTGLHYSDNIHDVERYEELAALAQEMLAQLGDVPVTRIVGLVPSAARGYATPFVEVRAAIFEAGRILLVQEKADGKWCLPGGFADIGLSPSENTIKEVQEEAGITVSSTRLFMLRHKAKHSYPPDVRDFYKLFFLCAQQDDAPVKAGSETADAKFFDPSDLPPLSLDRTIPADIDTAFEALKNDTFMIFD